MENFYTWRAVLVPNVNQPSVPRLILRRVPVSSSSLPGPPPIPPPNTPPGSPSQPSTLAKSPSSSPNSPSTSSSSSGSSSDSSHCSSPSSSPPVPEDERWTCVVSDAENKIVLRKLQTASSPLTTQTPQRSSATGRPSRFQANTSSRLISTGPQEKWVKKIRSLLRQRDKQPGSRGCKRAAGQPEGSSLADGNRMQTPCQGGSYVCLRQPSTDRGVHSDEDHSAVCFLWMTAGPKMTEEEPSRRHKMVDSPMTVKRNRNPSR
ncbi:putative protein TPRXL [Seriola dumerili]|uniref:putative protein TPRXL n=1 Tax=Seriola dumerili TaxID=41447 RepID=UPI000BBE20A8|nr:putative protein TPRXL [Seriola dumerili]